jgi:hypothetical protein
MERHQPPQIVLERAGRDARISIPAYANPNLEVLLFWRSLLRKYGDLAIRKTAGFHAGKTQAGFCGA